MLDSHPSIRCGPESRLFLGILDKRELARRFDVPVREIRRLKRSSPSYAAFIATFLDRWARREGGTIWAEKTPENVLSIGWILDHLPATVFCHVVRDGRAVVNSLRTHPRYKVERGHLVPTNILNEIDDCIDRWLASVRHGLEFSEHPRVVRIRYEDVVRDPAAAFAPLLRSVGLEWAQEMASFHEVRRPSRDVRRFPQNPEATRPVNPETMERWRRDLSAEQIARIEERGAAVQARLGYA